ncbi:sugar phosphate isomerase/epimerase family protein [Mucilaginibacter phyllosphaerae]|uniref:Sugar phosphate isomerase/epimerase n=1 Tax=Mucilaginibacter phyllosphaerae TaxID=1812349 RepID=A0A4Y8AIX7_9SPHI|nr:sugar phosphate isomerase/epimerase family protein [Mucilaginibacter phyllosphaerae]MBB3967972.1 sugar phosphate isomerase/epimerase [Mucilaginibacter phyllosphaerae]TEW69000.1 sugar phosphate isomerase/epimerase [Mucilaginibacter phyllosphaerae]GGH02108.1 sugar phosphate isomerase [Mucilaginibacter phyllosphaerae]
MTSSRRSFLKNSAIAATAAAFMPNDIFASPARIQRVGIQLYSVRDAMKTDPAGTLKKLADMGYKHVEHANYIDRKFYGWTAKEFKKRLDDLGLQMPSGHTVMTPAHWDAATNDFTDVWKHTVEDAAYMGQKFVISPWLDDKVRHDTDLLKRTMDQFNKSGELCQKFDMKFGYHNHDFEFTTMVGDMRLFDYIMQNTDPNKVSQQLDIGNMYGRENDAISIINKYPGRFVSMHVKDEIKSADKTEGTGYESTILGRGVLPVKEVLKAAKKTGGTVYLIIEQESYQGLDPIDCVKIDLQTMKKWGY